MQILPLLALVPVDEVINGVEEALKEHKLLNSESTLKDLVNRCQLLTLKHMVGNDVKKAIDIEKQAEETHKLSKAFNQMKF